MRDESTINVQLQKIVAASVKKTFNIVVDVKIDYPQDNSHGDYSCNIALQMSKDIGLSPREIAEKIVSTIGTESLIDHMEIAGPGFINFFLREEVFEDETKLILENKDKYGMSTVGKGKNIIVEYPSTNVAKPLGVHHLLSTIIGQTLNNIFKFIGYDSISINHIGDWGTQFGKLIYAYKNWGDKKLIEANPIDELLKLYVKFHDEEEKDPSLEDTGRAEFKKLEDGDKENREIWQWFVDESNKENDKIFNKIGGIHFDYIQGESFYEDKMDEIIEYGKEHKIFVKGEEGAYIVEYEDENIPPFVVLKKDGATLYSTRDFAAIKYRIETWKPEKIIYVVDIAQTLHFKQLFDGASRFPWYKGEGFHAWFGRMQMKDKKMSTRKGNVILLDEVLDEAIKRAGEVVKEKNQSLKNKDHVAKVIGIGAIKYNILSQNRTTDITFDWDKMLSLEGNSAPYLQYSYARAKSILRKCAEQLGEAVESHKITGEQNGKTKDLVKLFPRFKEMVLRAAEEYKPNIISNYLYELAQKFNSFYNSVHVINAEAEEKKKLIEIVEATSQILKNGLLLLGVEVVEEM